MNDETCFNPFSLSGKRILVTGATSGLGEAIAISCARMGAEMIVTGRDKDRLALCLNALCEISDLAHLSIPADLTFAEQRAELVTSLGHEIDGLVHSAGVSQLCPVRMISVRHLCEVQAINVEAPVMLTQALLKRKQVNVGGSILFISSIAAHIGVAGVSAYSGTKAALIAISRCLAMEVVKRRIRVNCLSPALIETSMQERISLIVGSMTCEDSNYPLGFGKPEDVANAAIFMLSDASRWITGTTLVMDGGLTIS